LVASWNTALDRAIADPTLSTSDRLIAIYGKVELAKLDAGKSPLPPALVAMVRDEVAKADRATTDIYERQAVISAGAEFRQEVGLDDASDALLTAELTRSHSPYYFMLGLAANAKKRGDKATALSWYERAYDTSVGDATRLQWGTSYINALVDLAPQ